MNNHKHVLLLTPHLKLKGGVSNFYNQILPYLNKSVDITILQIGTQLKGNIMKTITDYFVFLFKILHVDIVHINMSLNIKSFIRDGIFVIIAKIFRKKTITSIHGWDESLWEKIKAKKEPYYLWFKIIMKSDVICPVSEFQKKNIVSLFPQYPKNKIIVIPPPLPENLFLWDPESKVIQSKLNILFFGRIIKEKGVFTVIESAIQLHSKGYNINLLIGGSCSKEMEETINQIASKHKWIHFTPNPTEEEKFNLYKKAHIYCFPSTYPEGLPVTILEGMASGNIVITTPLKGIKDFLSNSKIIIVNNKEEIVKSVEKLIIEKENLINMMIQNRENVRKLEAANLSNQILSIYNSL